MRAGVFPRDEVVVGRGGGEFGAGAVVGVHGVKQGLDGVREIGERVGEFLRADLMLDEMLKGAFVAGDEHADRKAVASVAGEVAQGVGGVKFKAGVFLHPEKDFVIVFGLEWMLGEVGWCCRRHCASNLGE